MDNGLSSLESRCQLKRLLNLFRSFFSKKKKEQQPNIIFIKKNTPVPPVNKYAKELEHYNKILKRYYK